MAALVVHHTSDGQGSGSGKAITVPSTGSGNLLVAVVTTDNVSTDAVSSISDGTSSFAQVPSARAASGQTTDVWWLASSNGGKTSITVTLNQNTSWNAVIYEVSGINSPAVDIQGIVSGATSSGTDASGASVTPSASVEFGVAGIAVSNAAVSVNPKAGNEFTSGGDISAVMNGAACSLLTTSASAHQPVWTLAATGHTFCASCVFFADGLGPVGPQRRAVSHQQRRAA